MVVGEGFEPSKGEARRFYRPVHLTTLPPDRILAAH